MDHTKFNPRHQIIIADLTSKSDIHRLLKKVSRTPLDALLNDAGIGVYKSLETLSEKDFEESVDLNLIAPFILTKHLHKNLVNSALSLVLNIGSGAGVMGFKDRSAYCASKFGLRGMVLSLAEEYQNRKPHFCLITLGSTITSFGGKNITEQKRLLKEGKATFPVAWLADKLVSIIKNPNRDTEIFLYPSEQGFGE